MDPKQLDVDALMREADKRGNHQIDFDEFCEVMKATSEKAHSWNEVTKECFQVFDRVGVMVDATHGLPKRFCRASPDSSHARTSSSYYENWGTSNPSVL